MAFEEKLIILKIRKNAPSAQVEVGESVLRHYSSFWNSVDTRIISEKVNGNKEINRGEASLEGRNVVKFFTIAVEFDENRMEEIIMVKGNYSPTPTLISKFTILLSKRRKMGATGGGVTTLFVAFEWTLLLFSFLCLALSPTLPYTSKISYARAKVTKGHNVIVS